VQIVLLCEDAQHEAFARRFLETQGWSTRRIRVEKASRGGGSAEQFVRERFPIELAAYRRAQGRVGQALIVFIDGDSDGVAGRLAQMDAGCNTAGQPPRGAGERVAIFVPTRSIETWFAYLDGKTVDEARSSYPRLERERDCARHVEELARMCSVRRLRQPAPSSLEAACDEYHRRITQ
jgi:hypothetical protein